MFCANPSVIRGICALCKLFVKEIYLFETFYLFITFNYLNYILWNQW